MLPDRGGFMDGVYVMVVVGFFGICLGYIALLSGGKS
jgi:hypothetical protein